MVTIKYYPDPLTGEAVVSEHESVIDFIRENFNSRDDILDLRFFDCEILGPEVIDPLDVNDGVIAITHDSKLPRAVAAVWVYVAIAVVAAVATVLLMPSISTPSTDSTSQKSATNTLGDTQNEARIGLRIDDIFGYVSRHMPSLWQRPYRIGVDNQETEILFLCLGRGRYQTWENRWFDGDTRMIDIPNAQLSKYEPGTWPGNGSPSFQIGSDITEPIGIYRQSNDLNPSELLPPNDLDNSLGAKWSITGTTLTATLLPDGFSILDSFSVGDKITLTDFIYIGPGSSHTIYHGYFGNETLLLSPEAVDLGMAGSLIYTVSAVTDTTVTITVPVDAPANITSAWSAMTSYSVPSSYLSVTSSAFSGYALPVSLPVLTGWYADSGFTIPVTITSVSVTPLLAEQYDGSIGPFVVPTGATQIILNFTSFSGFYKLVNNKEKAINGKLQILIEELDINGNTTGNGIAYPFDYDSNPVNVRKSVFQTFRQSLPYSRCQVSVKRIDNRDKSSNVSNVDIIEWRDMYSFEPVSGLDLGDVTLVHVVVPSNSSSRLIKERKQNVDVMRMVTEYQGNGVFGPKENYPTDNFAQILTHMSLDPYIGRLTLDNINADGWLLLSDQIESYFGSDQMTRFGYDFDDTQVTFQDSYIQVAQTVFCKPYVQNGVYDLSFDRKQDKSSMQITCRNKIADTEVREDIFERQYDGVEVTWRDENEGVSETIYVPSDRSAVNPNRIEFNGCITREQAYKYAYRVYNQQNYGRYNVSFDVDEFGRNIIPGRRIDSPDSTRFVARPGVTDGYRVYDGEVVEVNGLLVELSEPVEFIAGEDHYITFTKTNGDNSEPILCTQVDEFTVSLASLPAEAIYDGYSQDRTKFVLVSEQLMESIAILPQTIEFRMDDNGNETNTVSAINYDSRYYKNDLDVVS